jgi:hypothetical protein
MAIFSKLGLLTREKQIYKISAALNGKIKDFKLFSMSKISFAPHKVWVSFPESKVRGKLRNGNAPRTPSLLLFTSNSFGE